VGSRREGNDKATPTHPILAHLDNVGLRREEEGRGD
jgi:hypothetical protein